MGPCAFNPPHVHPRLAESNIVVKGALDAELMVEKGATLVRYNATEF